MPTIPSGEIHYEAHGSGAPVLLVPGLGGELLGAEHPGVLQGDRRP